MNVEQSMSFWYREGARSGFRSSLDNYLPINRRVYYAAIAVCHRRDALMSKGSYKLFAQGYKDAIRRMKDRRIQAGLSAIYRKPTVKVWHSGSTIVMWYSRLYPCPGVLFCRDLKVSVKTAQLSLFR